MTKLFLAEIRRFHSRAAMLWSFVAIVVLAGMFLAGGYSSARPPADDVMAQLRQSFEEDEKMYAEQSQVMVQECLKFSPEEMAEYRGYYGPGEEELNDEEFCEAYFGYVPGTFEEYAGTPEVFYDYFPTVYEWFAVGVILIALTAGITFFTAEDSSGAISTWLTFEPRRTRVYFAKILAAMASVIIPILVALLFFVSVMWVIFSHFDNLGVQPVDYWSDQWLQIARTLVLGVGFTGLGVALGTIFKKPAVALGVTFALTILANILPWAISHSPGLSTAAVIRGQVPYWVNECHIESGVGYVCGSAMKQLTLQQGAINLLVLFAVVTVLGLLVFKRRDNN